MDKMSVLISCLFGIVAADTSILLNPEEVVHAPASQAQAEKHQGEQFLRFGEEPQHIAILRDDRVHNNGKNYSFDFKSEDGISRSESGGPLPHAQNAIGQIGSYIISLPDGYITIHVIADLSGYRPESLPVAHAIQDPTPQFVLEQEEYRNPEDEARLRQEEANRFTNQIDVGVGQ